MKVAVFGAGGIGGYFGARLSASGGDVHLIARGAHLEVLKREGLRVRSANGDVHVHVPASDRPRDIGACDVVLFCVKSTDTVAAAKLLEPLLKNDTAVVTLQNGIENEDTISSVIPREHVVGGVAYIFATISEPGIITHYGTLARIVVGELNGSKSDRLARFVALSRASGFDAELTDTIHEELWRKLAVICATAGMTAATQLPLGDIRRADASLAMFRQIVSEVISVAHASGTEMPKGTVEQIMDVLHSLPDELYSSLHYDLTQGKPMELDALHGAIVRRARELQVPAPMNAAIYGVLEPWAVRNRAKK